MPIGVNKYDILTPDQANPFGHALRQAIAARLDKAKAVQQEERNPFEARDIQSEIGLRGAQSNLANTEARFMPTKYDIERMNATTRQNELSSSKANQLRYWAQTPEGQAAISKDPRLAESIYKAIQQSASQYGYQQPTDQGVNTDMGTDINNPPMSGSGQSQMPSATQGQMPNAPQQNTQQPNQTVPEIVKSIQVGARDAYAKKNIPADVQKRLFAGERFKATIPVLKSNFELAKDYFSPQGKIQLELDERSPNAGNNPRLLAYRQFRQAIEQINVQGAMLEGVPADQISRGAYNKIFDIPMFFNSPEAAQQILDNGLNLALLGDQANRQSLGQITNGQSENKASSNPSTKDTHYKWNGHDLVEVK